MAAFLGNDDIVEALLRSNPDLTAKDRNGHTFLHRACNGNNPSTVKMLIKLGHCDPQARCPQTGWVPLHEAAFEGNVDCAKLMIMEDSEGPKLRSSFKWCGIDLLGWKNAN